MVLHVVVVSIGSHILGLSLSALDVKAVERVPWSKLFLDQRFSTVNVIHEHGITNEPEWLRRYISVARQFVDRIERV